MSFSLEQRKNFIKTKNDIDYTNTTRTVYNLLRDKYSYQTRISDIYQLLKDSFGLRDFLLLDFNQMYNGPLESWLVDKYISWMRGNEVDFIEIYNALITAGEFTRSEKDLFESGLVEERLWAIFLLISSPELDI